MEPKTDKLTADLNDGAMVACARHFLGEVRAQCAAYSPAASASRAEDPHMSDAEKCQRLTDLLNEPHPTSATTRAVARCFFVHAYATRIGAELDHTHGITARYVESAISYLEQSFMGESDAEQEQREQKCSGAAANLLYKAAQEAGEFLQRIVELIGRCKIESVEQTRHFLKEMSQRTRSSVSSSNSAQERVESVCGFAQQVLAKARASSDEVRSENERLGAEIADSFEVLHKKLTDEVIELRRREQNRSADDNVVTNYLVTEEIIRLIKRVQDEGERFLRKTSEAEYAKLEEIEAQARALGDEMVSTYDLPDDPRFSEYGFAKKVDAAPTTEPQPMADEISADDAGFKVPTSPPQRRRLATEGASALSPRISSDSRRPRGSHKRTPSGALLEKIAQFQGAADADADESKSPNSKNGADGEVAAAGPPPAKRGRHHRRESSKLVFETASLFESYSQTSTPLSSKPCTPRVDSPSKKSRDASGSPASRSSGASKAKHLALNTGAAQSLDSGESASMAIDAGMASMSVDSETAGSVSVNGAKTEDTQMSIDSGAVGPSGNTASSTQGTETTSAMSDVAAPCFDSSSPAAGDIKPSTNATTNSTSMSDDSTSSSGSAAAAGNVAPSAQTGKDSTSASDVSASGFDSKAPAESSKSSARANEDSAAMADDEEMSTSDSSPAQDHAGEVVTKGAPKAKSQLTSKAKKSAPTDKDLSATRRAEATQLAIDKVGADAKGRVQHSRKSAADAKANGGARQRKAQSAAPPARSTLLPSVLAKGLTEANTTVLLVGAQHSGKSTLISHLFGVRHKKIPSLTAGEHTKNAHLYSCKFADLNLHVIDTPGVAFDPIDEYAAQDFYNREIRQCNKVDLIVWVVDVEASYNLLQNSLRNWIKVLKHHKSQRFLKEKLVVVLAKTDRLASWAGPKASSGAQKYREFADEVRQIKEKVRHELRFMLQAGKDPKKQREIDGIPICVSGRASEDLEEEEPFGSNPWTTRIWSEFAKRIDAVDAENFEKILRQFEYKGNGKNANSGESSPLSLYGDDLVQVTHWTEAPDHTSFQRFFRRISSNA